MTNEELDRLQALCDAATEGPWKSNNGTVTIPPDMWRIKKLSVGSNVDGKFIAKARTAMPALIAEVRRHKQKQADLSKQREARLRRGADSKDSRVTLADVCERQAERIKELEAEVRRLEAENEELLDSGCQCCGCRLCRDESETYG